MSAYILQRGEKIHRLTVEPSGRGGLLEIHGTTTCEMLQEIAEQWQPKKTAKSRVKRGPKKNTPPKVKAPKKSNKSTYRVREEAMKAAALPIRPAPPQQSDAQSAPSMIPREILQQAGL